MKGESQLLPVLFVVHSLPSGGIERILLDLCRHAKELGLAPSICCLVEKGNGASPFKELHIPIKVLGGRSSLAPWHWPRNLYVLFELISHIKKLRPKVVQGEMFFAGTLSRIAAALCGVPTILHGYHNFYSWKGPIVALVERFLSRLTTKLIVPTEAVLSFTADQLSIPREKFCHIPNAIDCEAVDSPSSEPHFAVGSEVVTFCSRFVEQKRPLFVASIFTALAQQRANCRFRAIGDGPLLQDFVENTKCLGEKIEIVGRVDDVTPYLRASSLLLLPSTREGFGLVPGEALLSGCPVLLSALPPLKEVYGFLGDELFIAPEEPADRWVQKACALLDDSAMREKIVEHAKSELTERYSVEKMVRAYAELYRA